MDTYKKYAPAVLRISLALVFLWFGTQELIDTASWVGYIPQSVVAFSHLSAETLVTINALFEVLFGTLLLLGLFTRISAALLFLHMAEITFVVGYSAIGVRDFGLAMGALSVFLSGADVLSLES